MDRSRRGGAKQAPSSRPQPPTSSRLTFKPRRNRKRPGSFWSRLPKPDAMADACGRALRRSLPAIVGMTVIAAIGGTAFAGYRFVTHSPRFAITDIAVNGNHHLSADQVRAVLPARVGDNVFATSLNRVVRELRTNPWIADAQAHRILPHTIVVDIREHVPAALADLGGLYLVDDTGHPFKRAAIEADEGAGLPIVTGLDRTAYLADSEATAQLIRSALTALTTWRAAGDRPAIGEVHVDAHGALTLHTYDQATAIQLGTIDAELTARMQTFDAAWAELTDAERTAARAIHLDARQDHVTVAFADKDQ